MGDPATWFFISSGLFLGWSLGANNAVTLFGTAVASKMLRFRRAALITGIAVIAGAVCSGSGTTETIAGFGRIDAIAGSFTAALSVGLVVTAMTRLRLPVSATQAVIGAIVGWNVFVGSAIDVTMLGRIVGSWIVSPLIAGALGFVLFRLLARGVREWDVHMLRLDGYTRYALIAAGALAAYALGANNIGNVMGMFVDAAPLHDISFSGIVRFSGTRQLFLLGGIAIAAGIATYGDRVIGTVGADLLKITPVAGLAIVLSEFLVLFLFSSQELESALQGLGLPSVPLVPIAATQAFIGAVLGVGLAKDPRSIDLRILRKIGLGWIVAPLAAGLLTLILLFVVRNVFEQNVETIPGRNDRAGHAIGSISVSTPQEVNMVRRDGHYPHFVWACLEK